MPRMRREKSRGSTVSDRSGVKTHTLLMATEVEGGESHISNRKFFRGFIKEKFSMLACAEIMGKLEGAKNAGATPSFDRRGRRRLAAAAAVAAGEGWRAGSLGCKVGCRMATRSFCHVASNTVLAFYHLYLHRESPLTRIEMSHGRPGTFERETEELGTFSICRRVVFPALSRPRKSSLACLFIKPSEERTSQTVRRPCQLRLRRRKLRLTESCQTGVGDVHQLTIHMAASLARIGNTCRSWG